MLLCNFFFSHIFHIHNYVDDDDDEKNPFIQEFLLTLVIFNIITRLHVFGDVV